MIIGGNLHFELFSGINLKDKNDLLTSQVNNLSYQKNSDQRSLVSNLKQVQYKTPTQSVLGNNIDLQAFEDNKVKYAQVKLDDVILSDDKYQITVDSVEVMAYEDDKQKTSELKANSLSGVEAKAVYQLSATDKSGNKSKFIALSHETSDGKYMKLFAEDGSEVNLDITDESNGEAKFVFDSLESFENNKISQKIATQLKGQYQDKSSQDSSVYNFDVAKVNHIKQNKNQMIFADDGSVSLENQNEKATLAFDSFASGKFYVDGVETTQINAENGNLQYKDKKKSLEVNGSFNNVIYQNIKDSNDDITTFSAQGLDFVAVDSKKLLDINGEIDNVSLYNSNEIRVIDIDGLKNTRLEDKKNNILADINAGKVLQVVKKDKDGKTLSSYLLLKSSDLKAKDKGNGVTANIKADVLEFIQDKENKQNILLDANISGNINIDKTKSPVNATVDFALKGKRLVTESDSVVSDDGNSVSKYFAIKAIDSKGKLDHLSLNAGPNFLKDAISIEAKGGENGGKKLSFEFMQDKEQGTYFVRAKFIEGDKVKIKLFPFTLESKLQGNDALAELLITPKGQNYLNHLEIITNVVSANEITDWLDISNGGMLIARTGDIAGVGIEMMYQDHNTIDIRDEQSRFRQGDVAATYGAGVYYENDKGDRTSAGLMLSGDSEFAYQTNGRGVLKIFGKKMDKEGRIPATLNLYFKKDYADGDAFYAGVHADLASYTIDENKLNKDAAFFDGGRQSGKLGATIGYSKKLENNARFSITLGANNDFQDAAVCMTYSTPLGDTDKKVTSLTAASMDIVNELADQKEFKRRDISSMGPTLEAAVIKVEDDIEELHRKYKSVKAVELAKEKISKTLAMIKDGESNARKLSREFRFNQKDLKTLANLAKEGVLSKSTVESIKIITEKLKVDAYYDRQTRVLDIHSEQVKLAMKDFAKAFKKESSAKLHQQYLEKLSELSNEF